MIRYKPTAIALGPEDLLFHLERFRYNYARIVPWHPASSDEDDDEDEGHNDAFLDPDSFSPYYFSPASSKFNSDSEPDHDLPSSQQWSGLHEERAGQPSLGLRLSDGISQTEAPIDFQLDKGHEHNSPESIHKSLDPDAPLGDSTQLRLFFTRPIYSPLGNLLHKETARQLHAMAPSGWTPVNMQASSTASASCPPTGKRSNIYDLLTIDSPPKSEFHSQAHQDKFIRGLSPSFEVNSIQTNAFSNTSTNTHNTPHNTQIVSEHAMSTQGRQEESGCTVGQALHGALFESKKVRDSPDIANGFVTDMCLGHSKAGCYHGKPEVFRIRLPDWAVRLISPPTKILTGTA
ncbi:hypothetical protein HFD88_004514 [Aspergillus terreus]|nr:hypothetical protein HFD88_004514 [Aspergillus terreus]